MVWKKCKEQLSDEIQILIQHLIKEDKLLLNWNCENVVQIYMGERKGESIDYKLVSLNGVVA